MHKKGKLHPHYKFYTCVGTPPLDKGIQIPGKPPWVTFPRSPQSLGFALQDLLMRVPAVGGWCLDLKEGSSVYTALTLAAIATTYIVHNVHYSTQKGDNHVLVHVNDSFSSRALHSAEGGGPAQIHTCSFHPMQSF